MKTLAVAALLALAGNASATSYTMTFDTDAAGNAIVPGTNLTTQYAPWGVSVAIGPAPLFASPGITTQGWATNSSTQITLTDVGGGIGAPMSGNLLHSFGGWLSENGDGFIRLSFSTPIDSISAVFGGIFDANVSGLYGYNGAAPVGSALASTTASVQTVSLSGVGNMTEVIMVIGDYGDWVGVDNVTFNTVPAPASLGLLGLGALAAGRRRR